MWFFRKRLTDEQRGSLERLAGALNSLTRDQEASFMITLSEMAEFLLNCHQGRNSGIGRPITPLDDAEIVTVREALVAYKSTIAPSISQLEGIIIPEWAPSKFAKYQQEVPGFWQTHSQFIDMALEGLAPPDPLVDQPGNAKLNMFVSGIGLGMRMVEHRELKA